MLTAACNAGQGLRASSPAGLPSVVRLLIRYMELWCIHCCRGGPEGAQGCCSCMGAVLLTDGHPGIGRDMPSC